MAFLNKQFVAVITIISLLMMGLGFFVMTARAVSPPNIITYQGRVLDANGVPVSGSSLSMKFFLYTASAGGTCVWSNSSGSCDSNTPASTTARSVTLTSGLFTENLGDTSLGSPYAAIADSTFADNATIYLSVEIAGETLSPRKLLTAAPYALNADTLDGIDLSVIQLWEVGTSGSYENDAAVIVGTDAAFSSASGGVGDLKVADQLEVDGAGFFETTLSVTGNTTLTGDIAVNGDDITSDGDLTITGATGANLVATTGTLDFSTVAAANITLTPGNASNLVNVLTGNLQVGNGAPNTALNGEDAYIEGSLEVDGTTDLDGNLLIADTNIAFDGASTTFTTTGAMTFTPGGTLTLGDGGDAFLVNATGTSSISTIGAGSTFSIYSSATTIGNNSGTVAVNSSDWDISTTGAMTGIGAITSDGAITTTSTLNADGVITLAAAGVATTIEGTFNVDQAVTFDTTLGVTGNTTLTGDLAVNGDDITSDSNLSLSATGYVRIGDSGTPAVFSADDDLYVQGRIEVAGASYFIGTITADVIASNADLTFNPSGGDVIVTGGSTINIGGNGTTAAYNIIGDSITGASATVDSDDDLYIEGSLEVDGTTDLDGDLQIADTNIAFNGASTIFTTTGAMTFTPGGTLTLGDGGDAFLVSATGTSSITTNGAASTFSIYSSATTIGNNSGTVAVNSSDWDISTTGAMTGIGAITSDGAISTTSSLNADGIVTLAAAGVATTIEGTFNVDQAVTFDTTLGVTGNTTLTGDIAVNGDDITSDGDLTITGATGANLVATTGTLDFSTVAAANITLTPGNASNLVNVLTGNLQVGNGAPNTALNGEDAYIEGSLEVDGTTDLDGDLQIADTDISFDGASTTFTTTGAFTLNPGGTLSLGDGGDVMNLNSTAFNATSTTFDVDTTGAITITSTVATGDGFAVNTTDSGITLTVAGAEAGEDLDLTSNRHITLTSTVGNATGITLDANDTAGGGVNILANTGGVAIGLTALGPMSVDGDLLVVGGTADGNTANGDADLYVVGDFEVDGTTDLDGALSVANDTTLAGDLAVNGGNITSTGALDLNPTGDFSLTLAAGESFLVDASTTASTNTDGAVDLNIRSTTANVAGLDIAVAQADGTADNAELFGERIVLTGNDATGEMIGLEISSTATTNATADTYTALLRLTNAENSELTVTDAILITSTASGITTDISDAIDASATTITNAVNAGANFYDMDGMRFFEGTTGTLTFEDISGNDLMRLVDNANTGDLTLTGDLTIIGGDIATTATSLTINPASYTRIGDVSTPGDANGVDDLYVSGDFEADGTSYFDGAVDIGSSLTFVPTTTGTFLDFALETEWTAGTLMNADFASSTTQSGNILGLNLDFGTNLTARDINGTTLRGALITLPSLTNDVNGSTVTHTGAHIDGGSATLLGDSSFDSTVINWYGGRFTLPASVTQASGGNDVNLYGIAIEPPTSSSGNPETYGLYFGSDGAENEWTAELNFADSDPVFMIPASSTAASTLTFTAGGSTNLFQLGTRTNDHTIYIDGDTQLSFDSGADSDVDITTATNESLRIQPNGTGDVLFDVDTNSNVQITATAAPGVDILTISNDGQATTTSNVDALNIVFDSTNSSNSIVSLVPSTINFNGSDNFVWLSLSELADGVFSTAATNTMTGVSIGSIVEDTDANIASTAISLATGWDKAFDLDGTSTNTDGFIDIDVSTITDGFEGINLNLTVTDDAGADTVKALYVNVNNNATTADDTVYGVEVVNANNGVSDTDRVLDAFIHLNQADTNDFMATGILFTVAAGTLTNAIDATDAEITNALSVGGNRINFDTASNGGFQLLESADTVFTLQDNGSNSMFSVTDAGTTGNVAITGDTTLTGDLAVNGDDITSDGDLTINAAGGDVIFANTNVFNVGGSGSDELYNVIGDSTAGASASVNSDDDLYVEGNIELDGWIDLDSTSGFVIDADGTGLTVVTGFVDIDASTAQNGFEGINLNVSVTDDGAIDTIMGFYLNIANAATTANDIVYGLYLDNADNGISNAAAVTDDLLVISNSDGNDALPVGILFTSAAGGITTAISATDSAIDTALAIGGNAITGTNFSVDSSGNITGVFGSGGSYTKALCWDNAGSSVIQDCVGSVEADYAEQYPVAQGIGFGDIVVPGSLTVVTQDGQQIVQLVKSSTPYQGPVSGIVSNNYGDFTSAGYNINESDNPMPVALVGRVPVNVTNENGVIKVGDYLTTSSTPGYAMKATEVGRVIGMALDDFSGVSGQVMVQVNNGWYIGDIIASDGTSTVITDKAVMAPLGIASAETPAFDSYGFALRGSAWDGQEANAVEMLLKTSVTDQQNYRLSVRDTTDTEVAYITNEGTMKIAGDMVITGKLYPSDRGTAQTSKYIYYDGSEGTAGDFMRTNAKGWSTGSYDFAEMFPSDESLLAGEVVVFAGESDKVRRSMSASSSKIAGIVSTRPGFLAGENTPGAHPIALSGRVPTRVSAQNGEVKVGDPLTTSSKPGYAMKATEPGMIVGHALEPLASGEKSILAYVRVGYWGGEATTSTPGTNNQASGFATGTSVNYTALNMSGNIYVSGHEILSVGRIAGISDIWSIEPDGTIKTEGQLSVVTRSHTDEKVETVAVTSPESVITLTGTATLEDGQAEVRFEAFAPKFNDVTAAEASVRVIVTPNGPVSLYVSEKDNNHFVVKQFAGEQTAVEFDWMVTAYRKGYEPVPVIASENGADRSNPANAEIASSPAEPDPRNDSVDESPNDEGADATDAMQNPASPVSPDETFESESVVDQTTTGNDPSPM